MIALSYRWTFGQPRMRYGKAALCVPAYRKRDAFILIFTATSSELGPFVSIPRATFSAAIVLLTLADSAWADEVLNTPVVPDASPQTSDQVIYKGLIGNMLDTLPMDAVQRVDLQRTSTVISNTFTGRSLAVLLGLSNPVLMIGGLVWGLWSASNINPVAVVTKVTANLVNAGARIETEERFVASADSSPAEKSPAADPVARTSSVALNSFAGSGAPEIPRLPVIRIWLPQRASDPAQ